MIGQSKTRLEFFPSDIPELHVHLMLPTVQWKDLQSYSAGSIWIQKPKCETSKSGELGGLHTIGTFQLLPLGNAAWVMDGLFGSMLSLTLSRFTRSGTCICNVNLPLKLKLPSPKENLSRFLATTTGFISVVPTVLFLEFIIHACFVTKDQKSIFHQT